MKPSNLTYFISILWFIISLGISVCNDLIAKYVSSSLPVMQIAFCRFASSTLTLLPFILYRGIPDLKTDNLTVHMMRGALLFMGISAWIYGLSSVPISTATVISFSIPLFVLLLSIFFLRERITWQRWVATIMGFSGVAITLSPHISDFTLPSAILLISAVLFAALDVINKLFIEQESVLSMLFYSALTTTVLAAPTAIYYWHPLSCSQILLFLVLGGGANLILFFLLKAFALADATALAPYRYLELLISTLSSYLIFAELPPATTWYGAAVIIPAALLIVYSETQHKSVN